MAPTKLGPGRLSLGAVGSAQEFGAMIASAVLTPEADDDETIDVLSGDQYVDVSDETWTLEGSIYQDYDADSLLLWCNANSGTTVPFVFRPVDGKVLEATGKVLVRSVAIGGDVKTRNTSDFAFKATEVVIGEVTVP